MSVMASSVLVWVSCVILLPAIWAGECRSRRSNGVTIEIVELHCGSQYCCVDGDKIYCCDEWEKRITTPPPTPPKEDPDESRDIVSKHIISITTGIAGGLIFLVVMIVVFCVLCPSCNACGKRARVQQTVLVTSGGNAPQMPLTTYGQQPSYPGYQPVPLQHSSAIPTAPTPYMEAEAPAQFPVVPAPIPPPGQNYLPPPQPGEIVQQPNNPSYCLNP